MIKRNVIFSSDTGHVTVKYFKNLRIFSSFFKWMCPTKTLLKLFFDSNTL